MQNRPLAPRRNKDLDEFKAKDSLFMLEQSSILPIQQNIFEHSNRNSKSSLCVSENPSLKYEKLNQNSFT